MAGPEYISRVEVMPSLPHNLRPFRGPTVFYSDGKKAIRAREIGLPTDTFPRLAYAMDQGEKACHQEYRPGTSIGPYEVNGVPYPLLTVLAKGKPARKVLWEKEAREGIGVVSDVVIGFVKNGRSFAVTAHKVKSEREREELTRTLYAADVSRDVEVETMAALYRFNKGDLYEPGELYLVQLDHGYVNIDDMVALVNQLKSNRRTSGNMDTQFLLNHLTHHGCELNVAVSQFDEQKVDASKNIHAQYLMIPDDQGRFVRKRVSTPNIESIRPEQQVGYKIPSENTYQAESIALGFIS